MNTQKPVSKTLKNLMKLAITMLFVIVAIAISGRYEISKLGFDVNSNGKDLSIKTDEKINELYEITIREDGRTLIQVSTDDRDNYSESNGYTIHSVAHILKKHKAYEIEVSTNGRFARFGTFCVTTHGVLNKPRGWFSEDLEKFSRRCAS